MDSEKPAAADPEKASWKSLALPVIAGAAVTIALLSLVVGRDPPPRSRSEGSSPASTALPSAAPTPSPAPPPSSTVATSASATSTASPAPPPSTASAPPAAGERRARAMWDAMGRRRPANAAAGGIACTIEATLATTMEGPLAVRGVAVQCGGKTLYEAASIPASATFFAEERPALEHGSFSYALRYRDERAEIDTLHGHAIVDVTTPVIGAAWLAVANESRPTKERLSPATADERALPGKEADRFIARVTNVTGDTLVARDSTCVLAFVPYGPDDGPGRCDALVQCGPVTVIGQPDPFSAKCTRRASKIIGAVDGEAQPADDDPGLFVDERTARIWNGGSGARWLVTLTLEPPKSQ